MGMFLRTLIDATSFTEMLRAVGGVVVLCLLFGYRIVSPNLQNPKAGVLLFFVGAVTAGILIVLTENPFSNELLATFGVFFLYMSALLVSPYVDISTRAMGGVAILVGGSFVVLEWLVFRVGSGAEADTYISGVLLAVLGVVMVARPDTVDDVAEETNEG
ncbi:hypothetical protein SAMN04488556_1444 [Halostagnicola kamekurae]|uniref:Uncharacterized protein n=2 Tax=Halostagnicola kamekurae TaxID=619731 RepID=A0A1I6QQ18_9EURY|nr:hypothetical protein SAMN04488556_1444 [Halostagnicola kamekurae]